MPRLAVQKAKLKGNKLLIYRPNDMFSEQDVLEIINACDHPRDKALFAVLYEALRPHEALKLRIGDININDKYAHLTVPEDTKTGSRTIPIVFSHKWLIDWINYHPFKNDNNAFLFVILRGLRPKPMSYMRLWKIMEKLKKRLNDKLNKRYWNPYVLRHSRLTEYASVLTDQGLKMYAGWTPDSPMAGKYIHMTGKDLNDPILGYYGIEKTKNIRKPSVLTCPRCKQENPLDAKYCKCGYILSVEGYEEVVKKELDKDTLLTKMNNTVKDCMDEIRELRQIVTNLEGKGGGGDRK